MQKWACSSLPLSEPSLWWLRCTASTTGSTPNNNTCTPSWTTTQVNLLIYVRLLMVSSTHRLCRDCQMGTTVRVKILRCNLPTPERVTTKQKPCQLNKSDEHLKKNSDKSRLKMKMGAVSLWADTKGLSSPENWTHQQLFFPLSCLLGVFCCKNHRPAGLSNLSELFNVCWRYATSSWTYWKDFLLPAAAGVALQQQMCL